jgi:hypothetical protein
MRVRNFDPNTPSLRSANSFSKFRKRTKVNATKEKKYQRGKRGEDHDLLIVAGTQET